MIFLDIKKAYDSLDRGRALQLLQNYGVDPNICRIIQQIWEQDTMTLKKIYFGAHFKAERGVRQGDIVSPTIFNIVMDAVIRASEEEMKEKEKTTIIFYADDGLIGGYNHTIVQETLDK
jgi:Reverse transcriptase (RNA-dependent DNA polymerase)